MKKETKYFVTFYSPGLFVGETWIEEVKSSDPLSIKWPDNAYAFSLYQRDDIIDDDDIRYTGKKKQLGPMYYHPNSKIETLEEVKVNPNRGRSLVSNMECNKWDRVIWTQWGTWPQPYEESEIKILEPK
uniref:Uncharacterized protein n=1 Tax=viral metagenome TaxID=1070528 RepID=A0A6M3JTV9_9ZZZZ